MKKNKMMRLASVLLVLTLLSTSIISGTFAKYVTSATGTDGARVAKFGATVSTSGSLFSKTYAQVSDGNTPASSGTLTVISSTEVVAPGTKSGGDNDLTFTVSGTPEVAVKVTYSIDESNLKFDNWTVTDGSEQKFYCPIVFTIGTTTVDGRAYYGNKDGYISAINSALANVSATYPAGQAIPDTATFSISWEWKYVAEASSGDPANQTDSRDTQLGNATTPASISLPITATVEQVD